MRLCIRQQPIPAIGQMDSSCPPRENCAKVAVPRGIAICVLAAATAASGCMEHLERLPWMSMPPYHEPAGFSSTYHRALYQSPPMGIAPVMAESHSGSSVPEKGGPGYLMTDDRRDEIRESITGSRFAQRIARREPRTVDLPAYRAAEPPPRDRFADLPPHLRRR